MTKDEFLSSHASTGHKEPVDSISGLPPLFMRRLSPGEYSQCLVDRKRPDGTKYPAVDGAIACVLACVDEKDNVFFTSNDIAKLNALSVTAIDPFLRAFHAANNTEQDAKKEDPPVAAGPV